MLEFIINMISKYHNHDMSDSIRICEEFNALKRDLQYSQDRLKKMYTYPGNINEAELHRVANQFGYNSKYIKDKNNPKNRYLAPVCSCCELPINTQSIDLDYPTTPCEDDIKAGKPKYRLDACTSLFFNFIKIAILYLILRFFITDGYNLITNIFAQNCKNPKNYSECKNNIASKFSSYNKNTVAD